MDTRNRAQLLRNMLKQVAPQGDIQTVLERPRAATPGIALEGLESMTDAASPLESGKQKLAEDRIEEITPTELFALEAIVLPQDRPVTFVRGESYDDLVDPWLNLNQPGTRERISKLLPCIGRIELPQSYVIPYGGTGFIVGKGLLMTNRHVAQLFSQGLGVGIRYQAGGSVVDFKRQIDDPDDQQANYFKVVGVSMIHPYWDMALLEVDGLPDDHILPLSVVPPESLVDHDIVVIGYPARDDRSDLALQDRIFAGRYNVKRLQPGKLRPRARFKSFENVVNAVTHDASTLGGNSGSAIIDVNSGEVIALHFAGEYLKANYAVPLYELARDSRVASRLNLSGSRPSFTNEWDSAWQRAGVTAASPSEKPVSPAVAEPLSPLLQSPPAPIPAAPSAGASVTWTIPLSVTVSIGTPVQATLPASGAALTYAPEAEAEEGVVVNQDYSDRPGYDPKFLEDIEVPLPALSELMQKDTSRVSADALGKNRNPFELTYYHYSVYMNKRRRTAWFSAANVDGAARPNIGKRSGDRWYIDPRVPRTEQLGQEAYESGIDRGHLTRRDDTAWGEDVRSATLANNDTFHFTNCALQVAAFNRGKDRWQGLEQFLLEKHAKKSKRRMVVITGPLFAAHDPAYKNERMNYTVRCPLQYWKVCVLIREDGTPSATAFILGQEDIKDLAGFEETFDVAATQIRIVDLEEKTKLDFGVLRKHDHFAEGGPPGTLEGLGDIAGTTEATKSGRIIRSLNEIVV